VKRFEPEKASSQKIHSLLDEMEICAKGRWETLQSYV